MTSAGYAQQHLQAWAAAAGLISRAYRRRLDRRALAASTAAIGRGLAAAVRLQALWRGRRPRREYQRLLHAVRRSQVCMQCTLLAVTNSAGVHCCNTTRACASTLTPFHLHRPFSVATGTVAGHLTPCWRRAT